MCYKVLVCVLVIILNIVSIHSLKVSCKNEKNADVDWYYLYKLPKHFSNEIDSDQSGLRYAYLTSDTISTKNWQLSNIQIDDSTSFPGRTVGTLFNDEDVLAIAYNDEVPDGPTDFENGHTKGIVFTDGVHAVWLVHSVPKFPSVSTYKYPPTGEHFGQSFLCITMNATTQMDAVVTQLLFNEPNIYFSHVPERLSGKYSDLEKVINKKWRSNEPFSNLLGLESLDGTAFKSFAKGRRSNTELYKDWIAPHLDVDLMVESWRNGPGKLPSDCTTKDKVYNIAMIDDTELNFSFKSTMDHSKWAVTNQGEDDWICVGDINRAEHQLLRGGGTVCQKNSKIANIYRRSIKSYEKCNSSEIDYY